MDEQQKVKELVDSFIPLSNRGESDFNLPQDKAAKKNAKHCAIICVDEEIALLQRLLTYPDLANNFCLVDEINDLQKLKSLIEKL